LKVGDETGVKISTAYGWPRCLSDANERILIRNVSTALAIYPGQTRRNNQDELAAL
jgi:hypothetical protein